jgi:L-fuculose-phosphate aldolase
MAKVTHRDIREEMIDTCRTMNRNGLNQGTSGNLSHRVPGGLLITPTSLAYEKMGPKDIVEMTFAGTYSGRRRPSSEWRFHRDILKAREDVSVVLHTHSSYATTLAVHGRGIPAFHYMVAVAGGVDIRCAPYACFGTQELSDHALAALDGRLACLLGHHGLIVLADNLEKAIWRAVEIETLAKMYVHALAIGEPAVLTAEQMAQVIEQMRRMSYGQSPDPDSAPDAPRAADVSVLEAPVAKVKKDRRAEKPPEAVRRPVTAPEAPLPVPAKPAVTKALRSGAARAPVAARAGKPGAKPVPSRSGKAKPGVSPVSPVSSEPPVPPAPPTRRPPGKNRRPRG